MKTKDHHYEALLAGHSIRPTQHRILILKTILNQASSDFNYTQIVDAIRKDNPELTQGGISTAFRLFRIKGLITKLGQMKQSTERKGRPRSKFKITEDTLQKMKMLIEQRTESCL
ncbi:MAG TPA: hypothetical protein VIM65_19820 [Cyclobacteriaceae bacterium]